MDKTYLIIGNCGVGKTWLMKKIIEHFNLDKREKFSKIDYITNGTIKVLGKYDGSTFEGSDKLSMAVAQDFVPFKQYVNGIIICEGDRFTNNKFLEVFQPIIIKIIGDGLEGRQKRKSTQSERHLKSISTRVGNISAHHEVFDSQTAFELIKKELQNEC